MKKFFLKKPETPQASFTLDYETALNPGQLQAAYHRNGPALIIAGAGTGKTRTLIYRLARLVESGVDPQSILLLTFTRRAAREMIERAETLLDGRCRRVRGGTFHYFCNQVLHRFSEHIGFPSNFTILDAADAQQVLSSIRARRKYPKKQTRFPQKQTLHSIISSASNKNQTISEIVVHDYPQFLSHLDDILQVAREYEKVKQQQFVMDFDDLLYRCYALITENETVRKHLQSEIRYVMVDEYQDTNKIQADLIHALGGKAQNVVAVGDDAQSIYGFRGADHKNILSFPERFVPAKVIKLEENYRSTPQILHVANEVLIRAKNRYNKHLFTQNREGDLPALVKAPDDRDEAEFICQMLLQLREEEVQLNEAAVLFRNSRDSYELELSLQRKKIPFIKFGGQKFTDAAHIKDILAHVRILENPKDVISWNRVLLLLDGIGPKTAEDLIMWMQNQENPYELGSADMANKQFLNALHRLGTVLNDLKTKPFSVEETIEHLVDYYRPICQSRFDDYPKRLKDLESFVGIAHNFSSLDKLHQELVLDPLEASAVSHEGSDDDEKPLVLSTIHSAKGLEWRAVFIIQCTDGIIPSGYAMKDEQALEEELRLLYVAITRAAEKLFFSYPVINESGFGEYFTKLSRFLDEIDDPTLEPWLLVEENESAENVAEERTQQKSLPNEQDRYLLSGERQK